MKKMITVLAAAFLINNAFAADSYLYWLVDQARYGSTPVEFNYATIKAVDSENSTLLNLYSGGSDLGSTELEAAGGYSSSSYGAPSTGVYAGFSGTPLSFLVELWADADSANPVGSQSYSYAMVSDYISGSMTGNGSPLRVTEVVPEPTSGLMVLLGMAMLALRRRREKMVFACAAVLATGVAFAAANDALVTFSTPGPDKYADGETVLDGERYALVWAKSASNLTALPIAADGTLDENYGAIVLTAPYAKGGRCPKMVFEVNADDIANKYIGGAWGVYLLDTRVFGEGGVTVSKDMNVINAASFVEGSTVTVRAGASGVPTGAGLGGVVAGTETALPENTPSPTIVGIEVKGDLVFVEVENTVPYLAYDLTEGDTPDAVTESVQKPRTGGDDGKVILVAPAKEGGAFFRVNRK